MALLRRTPAPPAPGPDPWNSKTSETSCWRSPSVSACSWSTTSSSWNRRRRRVGPLNSRLRPMLSSRLPPPRQRSVRVRRSSRPSCHRASASRLTRPPSRARSRSWARASTTCRCGISTRQSTTRKNRTRPARSSFSRLAARSAHSTRPSPGRRRPAPPTACCGRRQAPARSRHRTRSSLPTRRPRCALIAPSRSTATTCSRWRMSSPTPARRRSR